MQIQKGDWALVTGASSGIGKAFAEALARRGVHLFAIALEGDELRKLCHDWRDRYGIEAVPLAIDLSEPHASDQIKREVESRGLNISVLINAAGFGYFGDFAAMPHEQVAKLIQVDAASLAQLCHIFLPKIQNRKRGIIINIASIAGCLPYPYAAVYSGAKSFVHTFTQALWAENREKGVKIISLCPGYTKTNFERVSTEPNGIHLFRGENPDEIAERTLLRAVSAGCVAFTRPLHPFKIFFAKLLPLKLFAKILNALRTVKKEAK